MMLKNTANANKENKLQSKNISPSISVSYYESLDKANDQFRNKNMVEINPKSLMAYLLSEVIHDPQRQSMFLKIVNEGIYELFIDDQNSRDDIKKHFQTALSDCIDQDKAIEIKRYLFEEYPEMFFKQLELVKNQKTLIKNLLQSEKEIFDNCLNYFSKYIKCWCNRGRIIVSKSDANFAIRLFNNITSDRFGICIPILIADI